MYDSNHSKTIFVLFFYNYFKIYYFTLLIKLLILKNLFVFLILMIFIYLFILLVNRLSVLFGLMFNDFMSYNL